MSYGDFVALKIEEFGKRELPETVWVAAQADGTIWKPSVTCGDEIVENVLVAFSHRSHDLYVLLNEVCGKHEYFVDEGTAHNCVELLQVRHGCTRFTLDPRVEDGRLIAMCVYEIASLLDS